MRAAVRCPTCGHVTVPAPLTTRQREILLFLEAAVAVSGVTPTQETIRAAFKFRSPGTLAEHLANLERKGYLRRAHNQKQGIALLHPAPGAVPS